MAENEEADEASAVEAQNAENSFRSLDPMKRQWGQKMLRALQGWGGEDIPPPSNEAFMTVYAVIAATILLIGFGGFLLLSALGGDFSVGSQRWAIPVAASLLFAVQAVGLARAFLRSLP